MAQNVNTEQAGVINVSGRAGNTAQIILSFKEEGGVNPHTFTGALEIKLYKGSVFSRTLSSGSDYIFNAADSQLTWNIDFENTTYNWEFNERILGKAETHLKGELKGTFNNNETTVSTDTLTVVVEKKSVTFQVNITKLGAADGLANHTHANKVLLDAIVAGSLLDAGQKAKVAAIDQAVSQTEKNTWNAKQNTLGFTPENAANKNATNGYAGLDNTGKVPASLLPSYVDDIVEAATFAALPASGETGKIYVTLNDNKPYRWSGSTYVAIVASPGSTDAVPEGSVNLYYTVARVSSWFSTLAVGTLGTLTDVAIAATDTYKQMAEKFQGQINAIKTTVTGLGNALASHNHDGTYEPVITKNTAFNKNFGTGNEDVARGNHTHADSAKIVAKTNTLVTHTGSMAETQLYSTTIPANSLGANGILEIMASFNYNSSANQKIFTIKLNGVVVLYTSPTSSQSIRVISSVHCDGSQSANFLPGGTGNNSNVGYGTGSSASTNVNINFAAAVTLSVHVTLADNADSGSLRSLLVKANY